MAAAMARQEHRLRVADPAKAQTSRKDRPRGRDPLLAQVRQAGKIINARAADDPYDCFGHAHPAPSRAALFLNGRNAIHAARRPRCWLASARIAQIRFLTK